MSRFVFSMTDGTVKNYLSIRGAGAKVKVSEWVGGNPDVRSIIVTQEKARAIVMERIAQGYARDKKAEFSKTELPEWLM